MSPPPKFGLTFSFRAVFLSGGIFSRAPKWSGAELEESLIAADAGAKVAAAIVAELAKQAPPPEMMREKLAEILHRRLLCLEKPLEVDGARPFVIVLAGVNGAGKTTTTAKLCRLFARRGKRVLLAAGDTFRAAAREQLTEWAAKLGGVEVLDGGARNPSAAAFDAVSAGVARGADIVLIDTAGRLPTQPHLMAELEKTRRAAAKAMENAPHETLLILDGTGGQNALHQARAFYEGAGVSGLVITKLDGTSRGGFVLALAEALALPIRYVCTGETADDIKPFNAKEYAKALAA